jgi:hypothetical protein
MKLISMTQFVEQSHQMYTDGVKTAHEVLKMNYGYCLFLSRPLELGMFVPCDEEGNVLEEPDFLDGSYDDNGFGDVDKFRYKQDMLEYQQAKDSVLFDCEEFEDEDDIRGVINDGTDGTAELEDLTVEELTLVWAYTIRLTPTALKQIELLK